MQQIELEFIPVMIPKKKTPASIKISKIGSFITLNSSFVESCGIAFDKEPYRMGLTFDKKRPLDWYLVVIPPDKGMTDVDKISFTEIRHIKAGAIQFKAPNHVRKFLNDFGDGKNKVECGISTQPMPQYTNRKVYSIITKPLINNDY